MASVGIDSFVRHSSAALPCSSGTAGLRVRLKRSYPGESAIHAGKAVRRLPFLTLAQVDRSLPPVISHKAISPGFRYVGQ